MSIDAAALLLSVTSLLVSGGTAFWAISIQRKDSINDERRFLRESIIFLNETLLDQALMDARRRFFDASSGPYHGMTDDAKDAARFVLSRYGVLGRMIRHEALSRDMFLDYWETTFQKDWRRLKPFVEAERKHKSKPKLFDATEELARICGVNR